MYRYEVRSYVAIATRCCVGGGHCNLDQMLFCQLSLHIKTCLTEAVCRRTAQLVSATLSIGVFRLLDQ